MSSSRDRERGDGLSVVREMVDRVRTHLGGPGVPTGERLTSLGYAWLAVLGLAVAIGSVLTVAFFGAEGLPLVEGTLFLVGLAAMVRFGQLAVHSCPVEAHLGGFGR